MPCFYGANNVYAIRPTTEKLMAVNLTGTWTGEMRGTNPGGMTLELEHDGDRIYGHGKFFEPALGTYIYDIQGSSKDNNFSFLLSPRPNQSVSLGNIQASCSADGTNALKGKWRSTLGTEGVFSLERFDASTKQEAAPAPRSVFIVHGHDEATKEKVARFIEKLGLPVVILHEQSSQGMTIIEKLEVYGSSAGYAIALLTPDDVGYPLGQEEKLQARARQNVVLEMGYFVGKLGRSKVCLLHKGSIELPSDVLGVVYAAMDESSGWQLTLARELAAAGYDIDLNRLVA